MVFEDILMHTSNDPNPSRKCGTKKHNAFYAEGGDFSVGGSLNVWTWLLGDGMEDIISLEIPARQVVAIDPILTVFFKSFMIPTEANIMMPEEAEPLYDGLSNALKSPGVADHVGANNYTAHNFVMEILQHGPSRRIPKRVARTLAEIISLIGPIPMMFTHSKIPVFKSENERQGAIAIFHDLTSDYLSDVDFFWDPLWQRPNWGMYARRNQLPGDDHFMIPILATLGDLDEGIGHAHIVTDMMRDFFDSLTYTEQPFGLSWLTKISYTMPQEGEPEEDIYEIPGLNIIDLDAYRKLDVILEDANERT